jgi:chemotaxis protein histidine kinase CheA
MANPNNASDLDLSAFQELYFSEAHQDLSALRQSLAQLADFAETTQGDTPEANPAQAQVLAEAYRLAHKLKGMSAAMHYDALAHLAETMETWLYEVKQAQQLPKPEILDQLTKQCDKFQVGLESQISQPST